ncbi:MAG: hypothetical protein EAZ13_08290 [Sphingobacteriia bacterium]|nr:MAG: hypothetical protein EAZ35_07870 [Sphingobacteriia bacterium]TAH06742.1 MAG: hypothetical protein EAZ13_08290 [Sphingobacteriia bacterium]
MEDTDFVKLWKGHYEKIDQSLAINKQLLREITNQKAESSMQSLIRHKQRGIIAVTVYLLILGILLFFSIAEYKPEKAYFIFSVMAIFIVNLKAMYDYIKHLIWAQRINYNGSISDIQQQLSKLQFSIISHTRIMCLQFPFFTTFYLSNKWFPQEVGIGYIMFQVILTGSFVYLSYWLYKNHTIENLNKEWFKNMIAGSGGKQVLKAMEFYKEIIEFKNEK